jgi:hypothetical protein
MQALMEGKSEQGSIDVLPRENGNGEELIKKPYSVNLRDEFGTEVGGGGREEGAQKGRSKIPPNDSFTSSSEQRDPKMSNEDPSIRCLTCLKSGENKSDPSMKSSISDRTEQSNL